MQSTSHVFVERQRQQAKLYHTSFALELGKEIMEAKLHNQEVLLQRYERNLEKNVNQETVVFFVHLLGGKGWNSKIFAFQTWKKQRINEFWLYSIVCTGGFDYCVALLRNIRPRQGTKVVILLELTKNM